MVLILDIDLFYPAIMLISALIPLLSPFVVWCTQNDNPLNIVFVKFGIYLISLIVVCRCLYKWSQGLLGP